MIRTLINQFLFPLQLLTAAYIFTIGEKRRESFVKRMIAGLVLFTVLNILVSSFWQFNVAIKFIAVICLVFLCFEVDLWQAVFDTTCAYATQHLAYELSLIIGGSLRVGYWGLLIIQLVIFAVVYTAAYYGLARQLHAYRNVALNRRSTIIVPGAMLFIAVFAARFAVTVPPANIVSGLQNDLPPDEVILILARNCAIYSAACCLFLLWIQVDIRKQLKLQHELDIQRQLWLSHKQQYEMSRENIAIIDQKCHDLKYQIQALKKFYNEDQREEYLDKIENSIMIYDSSSKTGSEILDTILTEKKLLCEKGQIEFTYVADGACLHFIDPIDLYAIITNALNNAIDSVMKLEEPEKRIISLKVYQQASVVFIQVENYFPGTLEFREGLPVTTKEDKSIHGYGLKSISYNVDKYNGHMSIDTSDEMFTLLIAIPAV